MTTAVLRWQRSATVLWRISGDHLVLREAAASDDGVVLLGPTGAAVWEELVEPTSVGVLAARLAERFTVDPAVVECDLVDVLEQLQERSLVRQCS